MQAVCGQKKSCAVCVCGGGGREGAARRQKKMRPPQTPTHQLCFICFRLPFSCLIPTSLRSRHKRLAFCEARLGLQQPRYPKHEGSPRGLLECCVPECCCNNWCHCGRSVDSSGEGNGLAISATEPTKQAKCAYSHGHNLRLATPLCKPPNRHITALYGGCIVPRAWPACEDTHSCGK